MMSRTHLFFAFAAAGAGVEARLLPQDGQSLALGLPVLALSALLPDIDHPKSVLGRALPFFSAPLDKISPHRGLTHSLLCFLALFLAFSWAIKETRLPGVLASFFFLGYASHLAGDLFFGLRGAPLLWPLRGNAWLPFAWRTGGRAEAVVAFFLALAIIRFWGLFAWMRVPPGWRHFAMGLWLDGHFLLTRGAP